MPFFFDKLHFFYNYFQALRTYTLPVFSLFYNFRFSLPCLLTDSPKRDRTRDGLERLFPSLMIGFALVACAKTCL